MSKDDPQTLCERLFTTFLGPLVIGGTVLPGKPIGGKGALTLGEHRLPSDVELLSRTELARVRVARKLAPIDTLNRAPSESEWALAACLHDVVQSTHPGFNALFRRDGPRRILDVIDKTLERIPPPASVGDALSRHTWFSRMFELARTDIDLHWWTGSERFLGTEPPRRLTAWPELRRVSERRTPRPLMDLPSSSSAVDAQRFTAVLATLLGKTPLTDLATMTRSAPVFVWTRENLSLAATQGGRTMVGRALGLRSQHAVDAALGRATRELFAAKAICALMTAIDLLRDRALMAASTRLSKGEPEPLAIGAESDDAAFAIGVGALVASHWIAQSGDGFNEAERRAILHVLAPAAQSAAAREVTSLLG